MPRSPLSSAEIESRGAVLLVDKPAGITSHDAVARARRRFAVKAGHAGTLDPFATGLLIVLLARPATREQRHFMAAPKTYEVVARFGAVSSTGDRDGELTETGLVPEGDLELPVGEILQRPPRYSAVKLGGERAYDRARRGEDFELPPRAVTVFRFEETERSGAIRRFEVECSSGTYVRTLVADLGDAYCEELRRTRIGPFGCEEAGEDAPIPLDEALARLRAA